jgi:hypothetical protein
VGLRKNGVGAFSVILPLAKGDFMQGSRIVGYGVALLVASGVIWYKYSREDEYAKDCRAQMLAQLHHLPDFAEAEAYYTGLLDRHHLAAFGKHYTVGGRRSSSDFDSEAYLDDLFNSMAADAEAQQQKERANELRELRTTIHFEDE